MAEQLTLARFRELADAYGGVVARWPEAVRAEAARLAHEPEGRATLEKATALDARLDAWRLSAPERALADRIVRTAPAGRAGITRRVKLWWSGIGLAAALAGTAAGSGAAAMVAPSAVAAESSTAFGDLAGQES